MARLKIVNGKIYDFWSMPCLQHPRNGHIFCFLFFFVLKRGSKKKVGKGKYSPVLILFVSEDPAMCFSSGWLRTTAQKGSSGIPGRGPLSPGPAGNPPILLFCDM